MVNYSVLNSLSSFLSTKYIEKLIIDQVSVYKHKTNEEIGFLNEQFLLVFVAVYYQLEAEL